MQAISLNRPVISFKAQPKEGTPNEVRKVLDSETDRERGHKVLFNYFANIRAYAEDKETDLELTKKDLEPSELSKLQAEARHLRVKSNMFLTLSKKDRELPEKIGELVRKAAEKAYSLNTKA